MKKYLATATSKSGKWAMFIGRWQPWHVGHRWLINQALEEGKNVLLCVREVDVDDKNPWTADEILVNLSIELIDLIRDNRLRVIKVPDIESINIGRGVGYDVIEHVPPQEIHDISATKIREAIRKSDTV
jgi:cytidyltransferase-like protein